MTVTSPPGPRLASSTSGKAAAMAACVLASVVFGIGYAVGQDSRRASVHQGYAQVGEQLMMVRVDGRTYGASGSVAFTDDDGFHQDGWPPCLSRPAESIPIRFGATEVSVPGWGIGTWRQVVWVDCR